MEVPAIEEQIDDPVALCVSPLDQHGRPASRELARRPSPIVLSPTH